VFTATLGGGSFLGDSSLTVAPAVPLSQSLVNTGFAYSAEVRARQAQALAGLLPLVRDIRRQGAASLDLCSIAAGRADIYLERTLSPWDHAAGALIAREAGAVVKGLGDAAPDHEFILAAHPEMAAEIEHLVVRLGL
jgi:myo-inositol-1(or 4)-monophosphatase